MLDDPGVVPGRECVRTRAMREREQPGEAKAAVAMDAWVGRLAAFVAAHERLDHGAAKLFAQVERHVWNTERMTCRACSKHRIGRAASTLGIGPVRIEPEPESDPDRVRQRLEQRNSTVNAATHRNRNAPNRPRRPKKRTDRTGQTVNRERLAIDRSSLEQGQPDK